MSEISSGFFKLGKKSVAVAIFTQLGIIHTALLLEHFLLNGA